MAGKPEREQAKVPVKVAIDALAAKGLKEISQQADFRSLSQLCEAMLFFAKDTLKSDGTDSLIFYLKDIKAGMLSALPDVRTLPPQSSLHLTLDCDAAKTLDHLVNTYPAVFSNRNDAIGLLGQLVLERCADADGELYITRRLKDALASRDY